MYTDEEPNSNRELATVPRSLRERLEQAQYYLSQNRPKDAEAEIRTAEIELIRMRPELYALIQGAKRGYRGIRSVNTEQTTHMERIEKRVLGIKVGEQWRPMTTVRTTIKTLEFF